MSVPGLVLGHGEQLANIGAATGVEHGPLHDRWRGQPAHDWYASKEYQELKAIRLAAVRSNAVFLEGLR